MKDVESSANYTNLGFGWNLKSELRNVCTCTHVSKWGKCRYSEISFLWLPYGKLRKDMQENQTEKEQSSS